MFLEIKANNKNSGYAYVRRTMRDGDKIKAKIIESLGSIDNLIQIKPNIIEELKALCKQGSIEPFKSRILNHDLKLRLSLNNMSLTDKSLSQKNPNTLGYQLLDKDKTILDYNDQLLAINVYAQNIADYQQSIDKINDHQAQLITANSNVATARIDTLDYALPPFDCLIEQGLMDAVVVAAGVGSRMGANIPKQYLNLGDKSVLEQTVMKLLCSPYIKRVIVVISEHDPYFKNTCLNDLQGVKTVLGGSERVDSVLNGLQEVNTKYCLVHDAARPLFLMHDLESLIIKVAKGILSGFCGGILSCKVADTLKQAQTKNNEDITIAKTVDRSYMYRAQTPQLFQVNQLIYAINNGLEHGKTITDEASALELLSKKVMLVEGSALNFKLTDKSDMLMAQAIWHCN